MDILFGIFVSYLIGSISFPGIYARLKGIDLWREGEGHLGATSIYSATRDPCVFVALGLMDLTKGVITYYLFREWGLVAAMLGHMFPVFFGFRGGNAVSVYYGGLFVAQPFLAILMGALEFGTSQIFRSRWRHAVYLMARAIPAITLPEFVIPYAVLFLRHVWFYYTRFHRGSSGS